MVTDWMGFLKKFFSAESMDATESNNFLPTYGNVTVTASAIVYIKKRNNLNIRLSWLSFI